MPSSGQSAEPSVEIVVCMGSSCFARGNGRHLAIIDEFLQSHGSEAAVRLHGCLCQDQCKQGPNVTIAGQAHHDMTPAQLRPLLQSLLRARGDEHGAA